MPDFLTPAEAAFVVKFSVGTLANWRVTGGGPRFYRQGRYIRYDRADLIAWMRRNPCLSTSQAAA